MNIKAFIEYQEAKNKSPNTLEAYLRDLVSYERYMDTKQRAMNDSTQTDIIGYLMVLSEDKKMSSTITRYIASIRKYFEYLIIIGYRSDNPTDQIKVGKTEKKELEFLSLEDVSKLMELPDLTTENGIRDRAILEVLYGTGVRVSELIEFSLGDLNLSMGFLFCSGRHGKERIVPIGSKCKEAFLNYLPIRTAMLKNKATDKNIALFPNKQNKSFSRQGIWNILGTYSDGLGGKKITPQILRNSFAVHILQNGGDIKTVQELLGNDDMHSMELYMDYLKNRIRDVYSRTHPRA